MSALPPVELLVCTTCKREGMDPQAPRPGAVLHEALAGAGLPENVVLKPVECLSNCSQGCSVVLRGGAARWTYVYGNLAEDAVDVVVDGANRYAATGLAAEIFGAPQYILQRLEEMGIRPDYLVGCSVGSILAVIRARTRAL